LFTEDGASRRLLLGEACRPDTHHVRDCCSQYACSFSCNIYCDICGHGVL